MQSKSILVFLVTPIFQQLLLGLLAQLDLPPILPFVVQVLQMLLVQTVEVAPPLPFAVTHSIFFLNFVFEEPLEFVVLPLICDIFEIEP
jgi:hypothetical protein